MIPFYSKALDYQMVQYALSLSRKDNSNDLQFKFFFVTRFELKWPKVS